VAGRGQLRIIGGEWRGRRLPVAAAPGLRPTADRVRETLFNWLQGVIPGARCLDLFAGSGALALEALSRGAESAVLVERTAAVARVLRENIRHLEAGDRAEIVRADAVRFLARTPRPVDVVFLDPPFKSDIIGPVCSDLAARGWLAPGARVYLEVDRHRGLPALPAGWEIVRQGTAGGVAYALAATI
jgi:16S rRNA (guanine966-N2)-methyltransferase